MTPEREDRGTGGGQPDRALPTGSKVPRPVANDGRVAVLAAGLVTSVGLGAHASCAAIRAGMRNPALSGVLDRAGEPVSCHRVPVEAPDDETGRLVRLAALALLDCFDVYADSASAGPLVFPVTVIGCLAESGRPGRPAALDQVFLAELANVADIPVDMERSCVVPGGRAGVLVAIAHARRLLRQEAIDAVVIVAADSLLSSATLGGMLDDDRLLTSDHSDGFMPGEAAGALLVGRASSGDGLVCEGLGFGVEPAPFGSGQPTRADGLVKAMRAALAEAGSTTADLAFRVTDNSGEHYYFREAAVALSRVWEGDRDSFDLWHPAQSIGEVGAASGTAMIASAFIGCRDGYAPGTRLLMHAGSDGGHRAAAVFSYGRG